MKFAKPEPWRREKARKARQARKARRACVDAVWEREGGLCQSCHVAVLRPWETDRPLRVGHVHEIVLRSRGGDPTDPSNCQLLCCACHAVAHRLRVA